MKKVIWSGLLAVTAFCISGCVVAVGNKGGQTREIHTPQQRCPKNPTYVEIDAAGGLISETAKERIYKTIARRPDLTPDERNYLIQAVMRNLISETAKEEILMILAENPLPRKQPCQPEIISQTEPAQATQ